MATVPKHLPPPDEDVYYPETDGQPMGETEYHVTAIFALSAALRRYFRNRPVYIGIDLFLYYEQGNPRAVKAPDVMVVKDVPKHKRRTFKTWLEQAVPCVVFEITSATTIDEDRRAKRKVYRQLGVAEYFLFDPEADALDPPLEGYRLTDGQYRRIRPANDRSLLSRELGLRVFADGDLLRLRDAATGALLLTPEEHAEQQEQHAAQHRQRAEEERQRAEEERQRAEQERQRAEQERRLREQEHLRAEQERQRAEQERQRAEQAEAQVVRLREQLERLQRGE